MSYCYQKQGKPKNSILEKIIIFFLILIVGFIVGILGSSTFLTLKDIAPFWPAAALQTLVGLLFDWTGVFAGIAFSMLSNLATGIPMNLALMILPANIIQITIPLFVKKYFNLKPYVFDKKLIIIFIFLCVIVPNLLGGLWVSQVPFFSHHQSKLLIILLWLKSNVPGGIIFGLILLKTLAPAIKNCELYEEIGNR